MPKPDAPETAYCECCLENPVEEPDISTKCKRCLFRLEHGLYVRGQRQPNAFYSKRRGHAGHSVDTAHHFQELDYFE